MVAFTFIFIGVIPDPGKRNGMKDASFNLHVSFGIIKFWRQ